MAARDFQLAAEKIKFEAIFEYASLGILVVNQQGEIVLANTFCSASLATIVLQK